MKTRKMVNISLLITFAVVIHTVETLIPVPLPVPGAKIGLANIITLVTLCIYDFRSGFTVAVLRSILGSIFAGTFLGLGFFLSFSGAVLSTLAMAVILPLEKRNKISLVSVSIVGAVSHNTAQVVAVALIMGNFFLIVTYLPILLVLALPTGLLTGLAARYMVQAITRILPGLGVSGAEQEG